MRICVESMRILRLFSVIIRDKFLFFSIQTCIYCQDHCFVLKLQGRFLHCEVSFRLDMQSRKLKILPIFAQWLDISEKWPTPTACSERLANIHMPFIGTNINVNKVFRLNKGKTQFCVVTTFGALPLDPSKKCLRVLKFFAGRSSCLAKLMSGINVSVSQLV